MNGGRKLRQYVKWLFSISLIFFIFTGCDQAANDVKEIGDDVRRVNFGGESGEIDHGLSPGKPEMNERESRYFPYQRGDEHDGSFHLDTQYDVDERGRIEKRRDTNNQNSVNRQGSIQNDDVNMSDQQMVQEVVQLTNEERRKQGLSPLEIDDQLTKAAQGKSEDMANEGYFSHQSPNYGSPFDMLRQFDISYKTAAENIAAGQQSPEAVVKTWMNSEGHRANILNESITHIGVGYEEGGSMGTYWTQLFIQK